MLLGLVILVAAAGWIAYGQLFVLAAALQDLLQPVLFLLGY